GGDRNPGPGSDALARLLRLGAVPDRRQLGRQRRADSGLPVAVAEAPNLEIRDGDEAVEPVATPQEVVGIPRQLELTERQRERAVVQQHLARVRGRYAFGGRRAR